MPEGAPPPDEQRARVESVKVFGQTLEAIVKELGNRRPGETATIAANPYLGDITVTLGPARQPEGPWWQVSLAIAAAVAVVTAMALLMLTGGSWKVSLLGALVSFGLSLLFVLLKNPRRMMRRAVIAAALLMLGFAGAVTLGVEVDGAKLTFKAGSDWPAVALALGLVAVLGILAYQEARIEHRGAGSP